jgi:molecular chaperone GrpE
MTKDKHNKELEEKIANLEQRNGELLAGWQRTQADFQNFRRQSELDRQKLIRCASQDLMLDILPVLDNFQLAAKHVPENLQNDNWVIGIKQIEKQLEAVLESSGLKRIETVGQNFDPNIHEAIEHLESEKPEGEIVEEVLSGYAVGDQILRPAKVKVSKGK